MCTSNCVRNLSSFFLYISRRLTSKYCYISSTNFALLPSLQIPLNPYCPIDPKDVVFDANQALPNFFIDEIYHSPVPGQKFHMFGLFGVLNIAENLRLFMFVSERMRLDYTFDIFEIRSLAFYVSYISQYSGIQFVPLSSFLNQPPQIIHINVPRSAALNVL